jgi:hypothetical protein
LAGYPYAGCETECDIMREGRGGLVKVLRRIIWETCLDALAAAHLTR